MLWHHLAPVVVSSFIYFPHRIQALTKIRVNHSIPGTELRQPILTKFIIVNQFELWLGPKYYCLRLGLS